MTIQRAIYNIGSMNTFSIDEKPFIPKKFCYKNIRVHNSFHGKATARLVNSPNPLRDIKPHYLLCAISIFKVALFCVSEVPFNTETYNGFIYKLAKITPTQKNPFFFLNDNATFHKLYKETTQFLKEKKHLYDQIHSIGLLYESN